MRKKKIKKSSLYRRRSATFLYNKLCKNFFKPNPLFVRLMEQAYENSQAGIYVGDVLTYGEDWSGEV